MAPVSRKEFLNIQANIKCGFTLNSVPYLILTYSQMQGKDKYLKHGSMIWSVWPNDWLFGYELSVCGFASRCTHLKLRYHACSKQGVLEIQASIKCGFTLKCVGDMILKYSQMQRTDKYSQQSSIIWPVWHNSWVFVYELGGCGFGTGWSKLKLRYRACFEQGVLDIQGNIECGITLKCLRYLILTYSQMDRTDKYSQ